MKEIWYLECVNLFKIICPHLYKEYKNTHTFIKIKKNDFVYFKGDNSKTLFLVNSGKVKIGYYTEEGYEIIKSILKKGEVFGEKAFLGEGKRSEFAQSLDNKTVICPIEIETLKSILKNNTSFTTSFYKLINFKIRKIERRLEILLYKDIKKRILEFLEEMKDDYGIKLVSGEILIKHPFSQKEMASLLGISRTSLNLELNNLKKKGILNYKGKEILVKNQKC